jgi:hypothetical protein
MQDIKGDISTFSLEPAVPQTSAGDGFLFCSEQGHGVEKSNVLTVIIVKPQLLKSAVL